MTLNFSNDRRCTEEIHTAEGGAVTIKAVSAIACAFVTLVIVEMSSNDSQYTRSTQAFALVDYYY